MEDRFVEQYIEQALRIKEENLNAVEPKALQEIAREMGLTEDDINVVERNVENRSQRARGFMRHELWADAIETWEYVTALAPTNASYLEGYATSLMARGEPADKELAHGMVNRILEYDPDNDFAFGMVKLRPRKHQLQNHSHVENTSGFVWPTVTNVFASIVIVVALLVINTLIIQSTFFLMASVGVGLLLVGAAVIQGVTKKNQPKQLH